MNRCGEYSVFVFDKWPNGTLLVILLPQSWAILFKILGTNFITSSSKNITSFTEMLSSHILSEQNHPASIPSLYRAILLKETSACEFINMENLCKVRTISAHSKIVPSLSLILTSPLRSKSSNKPKFPLCPIQYFRL